MSAAVELLLGLWITAVTVVSFAVIPALALGRPAGRRAWWPELVAVAAWSSLAALLVVPPLAAARLLNWLTALLIPLSWPLALWLYRSRGAPRGEFRALCRTLTLRALTWRWRPVALQPRRRWPIAGAAVAAAAFWLAARELRFPSAADYDTLAHTRALLAGGQWIVDPAASIAAVIARIAAVDPMQALRFLRPLIWSGSLIAAGLQVPSLNAAYAWSAVVAGVALGLVAAGGVHRRDPWHVVAACAVAALAFAAPGPRAGDGGGYVEYDAAARQALRIAGAWQADWIVVAPLEQRVELPDARRFVPLAEFVKRYRDRAGDRQFRFDVAGRELFVFVEKRPLLVEPDAALTPARYAPLAHPYWMPNARAQLERRALELCEAYRRTHAGVDVYYEDMNVRIYRIRH